MLFVQDYFLSEVKVEPLMVVGFEGLFGVIAMALILAVVQFLPGQEGTGMLMDGFLPVPLVMFCWSYNCCDLTTLW